MKMLFLACLTIAIAVYFFLPYATDWDNVFRPACLELLNGRDPYVDGFYGPPWALFPLLPLAVLPPAIGRSLLFVICLILFALAVDYLGGTPVTIVTFILSPVVMMSLWNGNLEALVLIGAVLPPTLGLFLVTIKPQMGLGIAIFWLVETWRKGGVKLVIETFSPISVVTLLSFVLWGFWPPHLLHVTDANWNTSLWPVSIPVGLVLLIASIRRQNSRAAMASSPCLSPYVSFQSWSVSLAALAPHTTEMIVASVGMWIAVFLSIR